MKPPLFLFPFPHRSHTAEARTKALFGEKGGFSLVEVTMALGIVSFAVIGIMGLLPTGLSSLRSAMNQTVEAQIVRSVGSQSVVAAFTNLASLTNLAYFDEEGLPTESAKAHYTTRVSPSAPVFPGASNVDNLTNSLVALKIEIVARPNPDAPGKTNFYSLQVANAGK